MGISVRVRPNKNYPGLEKVTGDIYRNIKTYDSKMQREKMQKSMASLSHRIELKKAKIDVVTELYWEYVREMVNNYKEVTGDKNV